ncbi:uncharacterized protein LOC144121701 [Amblyomma americanum]
MRCTRAGLLFGVAPSTVSRALQIKGWRPYRVRVHQHLSPADKAQRVSFCRSEQQRLAADPGRLDFLMFSDEAVFHLDGQVNRQCTRFWSKNNPHFTHTRAVNSPRTVVWCAIWREGVVGPFFFEDSVTADSYLRLLKERFLPELVEYHMQQRLCIFQQDGAPAHYASKVRQWLNEEFPGRWMGRGSPNMSWPPRSPDLTPCDFFVWGYIKSRVYRAGSLHSVERLHEHIKKEFDTISDDMRAAVFSEYAHRLQRCIDAAGGHFED